jgi:hypothetical protein
MVGCHPIKNKIHLPLFLGIYFDILSAFRTLPDTFMQNWGSNSFPYLPTHLYWLKGILLVCINLK